MRTIHAVVVLILWSSMLVAQVRVDVGTAVGFTTINSSFSELPGFPSCCPSFNGGSGVGGQLSLGTDVTLWRSLIGGVRLTMSDRSHTLLTREFVNVIEGNSIISGEIRHTIETPLTEYSVETFLGYRFGNVTLRQGVGFAARTLGQIRAKEEIVSASGATFTDTKSAVRNSRTGQLPEPINQTVFGVSTIGLDVPLTRSGTWILVPEVSLAYGFADLTSVASWSVVVPSVGVRLSYAFPVSQPLPPTREDPPTAAPIAQTPAPVPVAQPVQLDRHEIELTADVQDGIRIEEIEEERYLPILPYVFFDRGSAQIPVRYSARNLPAALATSTSAVEFHHRVLAVIAQRMRQIPDATITLVGTSSADESEQTIALNRARTVASVLTSEFGIPAGRIKVRSRKLPSNASYATGEEAPLANEENRRVEFTSSTPNLLTSYRIADTVASMTPPTVIVRARSNDGTAIERWALRANETRVDSSVQAMAEKVVITPDAATVTSLLGNPTLRLSVAGDLKGSRVSDTLAVPVTTVRLLEKRREKRNDSIIERYELVVFPFRSAELTDDHRRALEFVRGRIGNRARITIEGCTDIIGSTAENNQISLERARSVAAELDGQITVIGRGEPDPSQRQILPEERMLQRVVRITAVVPVR